MLTSQEPKYQAVMTRGDNGRESRLINRATGEAIPDDEPVFIFRARDVHAIDALKLYKAQCEDEQHRDVVEERISDFRRFAVQHADRMKEPDSELRRPWPANPDDDDHHHDESGQQQ